MALAPFFARTYTAVGGHLGITRNELEQVVSSHRVEVCLGESCLSNENDKWISELLVNLLARLYPSLSLSGHQDSCSNVAEIALAINPDIELGDSPEDISISVYVGKAPSENGFLARASGWVAEVGNNLNLPLKGGPSNPYSAGAAASLAAWRVFQTIFGPRDSKFSDISLSLLDYGTDTGKKDELPPLDLGEVAIAGIGAVGNPALWAWARHKGLAGKFHLIDPDEIELSNLQRYCLATNGDVGIGKVKLAKRELENAAISLQSWPCTLEDFASNYPGIDQLPTICVSVDNIEGRRVAQALLPRLVVNGWTSDNGLGASWHRFIGEDACLGCLYHPKGNILSQTEMAAEALGMPHDQIANLWVTEKPLTGGQIKGIATHLGITSKDLKDWKGKRVQDVYSGVVCGQVGVDLPGIDRVATVPLAHQSVLSGALMAAELIKRISPELATLCQTEPLAIWDDILKHPPKYWTVNRLKEPDCYCGDKDYQAVHLNKWNLKL